MSERQYSGPCECSDPRARVLARSGQWPLLSTAADWRPVVEAARAGEDVVLEDIPTFRLGWNRRHISPDRESLSRFAGALNAAYLLGHDESQMMGCVHNGKLDGDTLYQTLEVNSDLGRAILASGARPKHSIAWDVTEDTEMVCSVCESPMFEGPDCRHFPGDRLESGGSVQLIYTHADYVETSATYHPAVPGLGLDADGCSGIDQAMAKKRHALLARPIYYLTGTKMDVDTTIETLTVVDRAAQLEARNAELEVQILRERGERLLLESRDAIAKIRESGQLVGCAEKLVEYRLKGIGPGAAFDAFVREHLPPSLAHSTVQLTSGGSDIAADEGVVADYAALAAKCQKLEATTGETYASIWQREHRAMRARTEQRS